MTEIVADRVQFGPRRDGGGPSSSGSSTSSAGAPKAASKKEEKIDTIEYPEEDIKPEDIPF